MKRDNTAFKDRFQRWKNGELVYENGRVIPHLKDGADGYDGNEEVSDNTRVVNTRVNVANRGKVGPSLFELMLAKHNAELIGPAPNISLYEKDLNRLRAETKQWAQLKKAAEEATDEFMLGLLDPRYAAVGFGVGQALKGLGAVARIGKNLYKTVLNRPSSTYKNILRAAESFTPAAAIDNDVAARYYLSGEQTPQFDFVYHGRGTNRGPAEEVLRNYSAKDVGLHITPKRSVAEKFAKFGIQRQGILYEGVDINPNKPDLIASDLGIWDAENWANALRRSELITPELENEAIKTFSEDVVDKNYSLIKSIRDIANYFKINKDDVKDIGDLITSYKMSRDFDMIEDANAAFANLLKEKRVKFDYINDYEGGGYRHPSRFISDPSDIWWNKLIFATPHILKKPAIEIAYNIPFIKNGELLPSNAEIPTYIYK